MTSSTNRVMTRRNDFMDRPGPFEAGIKALHLIAQRADKRNLRDVLYVEQSGAQPVVYVMGVVGDVVGERGALRLGAGEKLQLQRKQRSNSAI